MININKQIQRNFPHLVYKSYGCWNNLNSKKYSPGIWLFNSSTIPTCFSLHLCYTVLYFTTKGFALGANVNYWRWLAGSMWWIIWWTEDVLV